MSFPGCVFMILQLRYKLQIDLAGLLKRKRQTRRSFYRWRLKWIPKVAVQNLIAINVELYKKIILTAAIAHVIVIEEKNSEYRLNRWLRDNQK